MSRDQRAQLEMDRRALAPMTRAEARSEAEEETMFSRMTNTFVTTVVGAGLGAAVGAGATAVVASKVASAGIGAAGSVVGGVASGGLWSIPALGALSVFSGTGTGSTIVNTASRTFVTAANTLPKLLIGGGAVAGAAGGFILSGRSNESRIVRVASEKFSDAQQLARANMVAMQGRSRRPQMMQAANAQAEELGLMSPGAGHRPRIPAGEAAEMVA